MKLISNAKSAGQNSRKRGFAKLKREIVEALKDGSVGALERWSVEALER
jgi:hypothetical protein